ncbi:CitMHS family citrate-Mg2+:H+ or citrate-Ca2+:H+ symporter [Neolewinella xylanilytica]|uniref:CitMHS family citrate-Mg2+:H+ or citrate-Ca2+:H+ symporter n=1 Tax=Neolewinella xylanilytica TaxID=1514080 RepID=A0A2S6IA88_9BACT|nr:citrate:proton symporter [Neolewinella xylanilytica]PPK88414.1 CitMHS family citrate-Mg2+:H+ or citrate-Ca2+:H+ symporter [Neolewinella xylanilytica]
MLAFLGLLTILLLLVLIISKILSPVVALVAVPVTTALLGGFGWEISAFITDGLTTIAPTAVMFVFAILFFGIMTDAGTFEPVIGRLLRAAGNDPARITVVTALLAMLVHLDGSGAVTFLITVPAMLPLYDALGMRRTTLATVVALGAGTMNILPWGGPTIRAATALEVPVTELFNPILLPVLVGLASVLVIAWWLGRREGNRLADELPATSVPLPGTGAPPPDYRRPGRLWFNGLLILVAVGLLITAVLPPHVVFIGAFVIGLTVNYPRPADQRERIDAHAKAALLMASILFAAGCFTGILKSSGMIAAMADAAVDLLPVAIGERLPVLTGLVSMPACLLFDPDSFYFGILPLLSSTATEFGVDGLEVGRAAIMGQMTTGFPVSPLTGSTYLLVGLTGVDLGDHQRRTIPLAFLVTLIILFVAILIGAVSI